MRILVTLLLTLVLNACGSLWGEPPSEIEVGRGDTLYSISKRYDYQLRDLIDTNNLKPPYTLKVGQILIAPATNYHTVKKGDTLYSISRQYGVEVKTIADNNGLDYPYTLVIGQKLVVRGKNKTTLASNYSPPKPNTSVSQNSQRNTTKAKKTATRRPTSKPTKISKYRKTKFLWPVKGTIVSKYGAIGKGRANDGINIKAPRGTSVKAADKGMVAYSGNELKGFGNLILIRHDDGWITAYAHNEKLLVKKGQRVERGEKIATVGSTGGTNTPQLHFEIRAGKNPVNPVNYLQ
ncbi:MAG: M23 family metallopeptidase [Alphaproteobacteria bacterium]|nr:M23 family metallopeptidase [Alphaproteobacteria bacterium]